MSEENKNIIENSEVITSIEEMEKINQELEDEINESESGCSSCAGCTGCSGSSCGIDEDEYWEDDITKEKKECGTDCKCHHE